MNPIAIGEFAAITVICFLLAEAVKAIFSDEKQKRYLPIFCGTLGLLLGVAAWLTGIPEFPAHDWLTACAVGVLSGLAATGAHQVYKQLTKESE